MCIVDWDQFWLTLAAWWFFVDWDEIWLSVGAWFAFAGFHLTIFEFVGDLDDTPPRVVSVRAAWVIALIPFNFVASLICCFLILFDYRELLQPVYGLAIIAASICQAELLVDLLALTLAVLNKKLPPRTALEVVVTTV